jgi:hypothetical protein
MPDEFDAHFHELWRVGFGKDKVPLEDQPRLDTAARQLVNFYTRIFHELPNAFAQTNPTDNNKGAFAEVYPALEREASECFQADQILKSGLEAPVTDGSKMQISFITLYESLKVTEHLRILRMCAEELVQRFPVDEIEDARESGTS